MYTNVKKYIDFIMINNIEIKLQQKLVTFLLIFKWNKIFQN